MEIPDFDEDAFETSPNPQIILNPRNREIFTSLGPTTHGTRKQQYVVFKVPPNISGSQAREVLERHRSRLEAIADEWRGRLIDGGVYVGLWKEGGDRYKLVRQIEQALWRM